MYARICSCVIEKIFLSVLSLEKRSRSSDHIVPAHVVLAIFPEPRAFRNARILPETGCTVCVGADCAFFHFPLPVPLDGDIVGSGSLDSDEPTGGSVLALGLDTTNRSAGRLEPPTSVSSGGILSVLLIEGGPSCLPGTILESDVLCPRQIRSRAVLFPTS